MATKNKATPAPSGKSNRWEINRKRKLEKQLKLQPNNEQVKLALQNIHRRRKTPTNREWTKTWIRIAKLFKLFSGRFDRNMMSSNQAVAASAMQKPGKIAQQPQKLMQVSDKNFFSLAARIQGGK